ncbi:putative iron-regulated membrane protein [Mucilaginibacter yixingensis]|uniref:Putative iron-regulated membrane protein n=1 Tax=Mucilaginibacter yixingensis TaxID=1295612 RepID=A0A2T5JCG0_9SPHI|nr:PepSY-associated TM helix domain-containing protein [Mucilaginibacter yixingensis]PTQ99457.1 putative iron-regulated membrane protein [Mucilaginibacter yixingensis]
MTPFKKTILFLHRWLGFISGLVVFIVSITGCLFVFQDELQDAFKSYRHVEIEHKSYLAPSELKQAALKQFPKGTTGFMAYYGKDRPALVMVTTAQKTNRYVYINPYSGRYLHDEDITRNFFIVVEYIHLYLLLPPKIGQLVVGISVIVFVVLLITGMVLWWPKRKSDRKRSLTIKWNGRWRRVNYDLHNVLGFYAFSISLVLALTGLCIAFNWMSDAVYKTTNLGKSYAVEKYQPKSDSTKKSLPYDASITDRAFEQVQRQTPQAEMFYISEADRKTPAATTYVTAYYSSMHFYRYDSYQFDQFTGKVLKYLPHQKKSAGEKMNAANYDIHVGQILGFPGKVIAFFASLICASLPVTGFVVWLGKRNKKKRDPRIRHHKQLAPTA